MVKGPNIHSANIFVLPPPPNVVIFSQPPSHLSSPGPWFVTLALLLLAALVALLAVQLKNTLSTDIWCWLAGRVAHIAGPTAKGCG